MRSNTKTLREYSELKEKLLSNESSFYKQEGCLFSGYNLGKDAFIRQVLKVSGYHGVRFLKSTHDEEWKNYHRIKKEQIFDPLSIVYDINHHSFSSEEHMHFVLTKGTIIVAIAHIEFLNGTEVALRVIATDKPYQNKGFGRIMMIFLERYCKQKGIKVIKLHSSTNAEGFYRKLGYIDMSFDDKSINPVVVDLGKILDNKLLNLAYFEVIGSRI